MLRKRHGQVVCLAPASSEGSVDGLGSVFAEAFPTKEEVEAAASIPSEESTDGESEQPEESEEDEQSEATDAAEQTADVSEPTADANAQLASALDENKTLAGQVALLTSMNDKLNAEKSQLQVELDKREASLEEESKANAAMRPAVIRQIKTLSIATSEAVPSDLNDKSATELGSICASLIKSLESSVPAGRQSQEVPSGSDGEPAPTAVPSAKESGLAGY